MATLFSNLANCQGPELPEVATMQEGICLDYKELIRVADVTTDRIRHMDTTIGQEGLFSMITRFLSGILNTLMHVVHTFKTNIFKFYKDLKRTELRYYHESNVASVRRVLNMDYGALARMSVPIPNGMVTTYDETVEAIDKCQIAMDMTNRVASIKKFASDVHDRVLSFQSVDEGSGLLLQERVYDIDGIIKSFTVVTRNLTNKNTNQNEFSKVFPTPASLPGVDKRLLDMEHYQTEVAGVFSALEKVEEYFTNVLKFISSNQHANVSKKDLQSMSVICTVLAKLFDMYGVVSMDQHRVEHNVVETLKLIRKQYNL